MKFIPDTEWPPGAKEFEEKACNGQSKLFDRHDRLVPRGALESLTVFD